MGVWFLTRYVVVGRSFIDELGLFPLALLIISESSSASVLNLPRRCLRLQAPALAFERFLAGLLPRPLDGAFRPDIPALDPVPERIAVPGLLECDRRQTELRPQRMCLFHEFLLGQRERRHRALEGGIDQELRAKSTAGILRALHAAMAGRDIN